MTDQAVSPGLRSRRRPAALALLLLLATPLRAETPTEPKDMPLDLWSAFKAQAAPEGLITLGATGLLFAAARPLDRAARPAGAGPRPPVGRTFTDAGDDLGNGAVLLGAMGAAYGAGWASDRPELREAGALGLEALALAGLEADALKLAKFRTRPDGSDHYSFPSGHAAESFAAATTLASQFGPAAGVPAYLAAGFVGWMRLQADKHWLSDVAAGAGLGILAGRAVWRVHEKKGRLGLQVGLLPGGGGALASLRF